MALFVGGISTFFVSFFSTLFTIEIVVFRQINKLWKTIKGLKPGQLSIGSGKVQTSGNPLKAINQEIEDYVDLKQEEIEELRKNEVFRREFLADVSHELKTPIFAAQGFVHTLLDGAKDDPQVSTRFLKKAAKSLDGLNAIVNDIVTLTQVEKGDVTMNFLIVNAVAIAKDIVDQLENKAKKRGIKLKVKPKGIKHCSVYADAQRISQVLTNFVDNAIKYGRENGNVVVEFEEREHTWQISVEDDGPGIPQEHLDRIFERFYRIDKSRSRETGGTGLGLAIVKHILNAHESSISVSSKIDQGTRFTFSLRKEEHPLENESR